MIPWHSSKILHQSLPCTPTSWHRTCVSVSGQCILFSVFSEMNFQNDCLHQTLTHLSTIFFATGLVLSFCERVPSLIDDIAACLWAEIFCNPGSLSVHCPLAFDVLSWLTLVHQLTLPNPSSVVDSKGVYQLKTAYLEFNPLSQMISLVIHFTVALWWIDVPHSFWWFFWLLSLYTQSMHRSLS